jgi:glycosyltransferase involved in cell wall biosynthesis
MSETDTERYDSGHTGPATTVDSEPRLGRLDSSTELTSENPGLGADGMDRAAVGDGRSTDVGVTLVMPTMDEEAGVGECIRQATAAFERIGVPGEIIVSDSSVDRTPDIARRLGATVVTPDRKGYGYAYRYAFQFVRGEYVAIADADLTYDFADMPALVALAEAGADMAIGSRFRGQIDAGAMPPLHRYVGNPFLTWLLNRLYGLHVTDAHSGFRVFRRDALERLELRADGMEFASELITAAASAGMDIREAPIAYHSRAGETKLHSFAHAPAFERYLGGRPEWTE